MNLQDFEDRIKGYENIWKTYSTAKKISDDYKMEGEQLDFFMSKGCRAWFFAHHLKVEREGSDQEIRDQNAQAIVPFDLSKNQFDLLDIFEGRILKGLKFRQRIMKCRRAKVSTIYLAIGYHIIRFGENKKGLCFTDRLETSRKLRRILDIFYQTDDLFDKPEIGKKTLCEGLYLHPPDSPDGNTDRDSFILLGSGEQSNAGIGGSLDFMLWSEASLTSDAERHWTTISPSLQGALFDVAESTPSLTGQDAIIFPEFEKPSENSDCRFISWLDVPEYRIDDLVKVKEFAPYIDHNLYGKEAEIIAEFNATPQQMLWRRFKLDEIKNLNAFRQVFPISKEEAFYGSAGLFFHKDWILMVKPKNVIEAKNYILSDQGAGISAMVDSSGSWKLYETVDPMSRYLVAVDTAEGKCADKEMRDSDYSVVMVFKMGKPVIEVGIFRDRLPPEVLGEQVSACARYFNNALVIPERNAAGLAMIVRLLQIYSNIYRQHKLQAGTFVMTEDFGFQTTSTNKIRALSALLLLGRNRNLVVQSEIIFHELQKFIQVGLRYGAASGHHDDTITCLWLMAECINQMPSLLEDVNELFAGQPGLSVGYSQKAIERDEWAYARD